VPEEFLAGLERSGSLCVVEEHVAAGGVGQMLALYLLRQGIRVGFEHVCAQGYPSGLYGSQNFHRKECGLDPESVKRRVLELQACHDG